MRATNNNRSYLQSYRHVRELLRRDREVRGYVVLSDEELQRRSDEERARYIERNGINRPFWRR